MSADRIRPCAGCGRPTRPSGILAMDAPGTIVRGNATMCITCYSGKRPTPHRSAGAPREVVFAIVPDPRHGQRADCRSSCCKTPFMCAREFRCACHQEAR